MTVDTNLERQPKQQKLRNAEYYDMQDVMDKLYEESCKGKAFHNLMHLITSENNILLAFRNIKNNKGSMTKGTDGKTITQYKGWSEEQFAKYFQSKFANYHPKSVRRTEIPKVGQPDKMRPLGIPCMDDRIIQQCIIQVLEPICEAKFHAHSYGFRPNRSASHAIARAQSLMNVSKLHYVVDVDIKGFFDNVNHGKLLKQMWTMGIRDKNLICIIGKILKSEIEGIGRPDKGTPQGGIISPLLSNIVLNELDWWLSDQWETKSTRYPYTHSHKYEALKKSKLKEFFFVRYADDFKILCRDYKTAKKIFIAVKEWLWERLGLEISPEKSKITNVRKKKTDFLGFALYVTKKGKKYVSKSNISEKAKKTMKTKLKEQIKVIQHDTSPHQVSQLNAMILGMHNYYNVELNNRMVCFDIKELGKQLKKLGMLIIQDQVWNRVTVNRGVKSTWYYIDEFHLLLKEEQTASYSVEIFKRFRKWGGIPTGITQNIKDLLASREIENIFENSDFILMLNQAAGDRQILAKQLNISPYQLSYVTNSGEGEGLLFYGTTIIPFKDKFDKSLKLYSLMTTKPEEVEQREKEGGRSLGRERTERKRESCK